MKLHQVLLLVLTLVLSNEGSYLYITFHSEKNVYRIPTNATNVKTPDMFPVLLSGPSEIHGLRSISLTNHGQLLVDNSYTSDSKIIVYGTPNSDGQRAQLRDVATASTNPYLNHPYGIAVNNRGDQVYASSQDTNSVTRYYISNGDPVPNPPLLGPYPPGSFVLLQTDGTNNDQGIRAIAFDNNGLLYIAHEKLQDVLVYDQFGILKAKYSVGEAIGLYFMANYTGGPALFVSTKDDYVTLYSIGTWRQLLKFKGVGHGAGLAVSGGTLYVISQDTNSILKYNIYSGAQTGEIKLPKDTPEQIIIVAQ